MKFEGLIQHYTVDIASISAESALVTPRLTVVWRHVLSDFDGDGQIGKEDLRRVINCLTKHELTFEEVDFFCDKVEFSLASAITST